MPGSTGSPDAYSVLLSTDFGTTTGVFIQTYELLSIEGYPALASELARAYNQLRDDVLRIAREVAKEAKRAIVEEEVVSRVRPDTGGDGGPRLETFLGDSFPLDSNPGSVGINFEPPLYDNVPWWWTNEEGYSGHVGRVVHGLFYDQGFTSASSPDPSRFREHPLFRAEGPQRDTNSFGPDHDFQPPSKAGKGERPGMLIRNPIPAREFVRKGAGVAEAMWHSEMRAAKAAFMAKIGKIVAAMQPRAIP